MRQALDIAVGIWLAVFIASFLTSIVFGAVQAYRRKPMWDSPVFPYLAALHYAWAIPLALPILLPLVVLQLLGRSTRRRSRP